MKDVVRAVPDANLFDLDLHHKYLFFRRTKIVATIGPASSSPAVLRKLIQNGLSVARINFSHGEPETHLRTIRAIRKVSAELRRPVAILGDLCGPKIRVGRFVNDQVALADNARVAITVKPCLGTADLIPCQYRRLPSEVRPGEQVLLDDGNIELKVTGIDGGIVRATVVRGGVLKNNKGMNLPNTAMRIPALTAKDRRDALYCIRGEVDYIALSFVRRARDVADLRRLLARHGSDIAIVAKIEKPAALDNFAEILAAADGIMVARGDLGVELPAKKVPLIQNKIIEACVRARKPVIVATQMLESMIEHSRPTRAEVTDVAAACLAGADAVMLSAETASGKYPVDALSMMDSILREAEAYQFFSRGGVFREPVAHVADRTGGAIGAAIAQLSRDLMVRCVVVPTRSGRTVAAVSSDRPAAPIIALPQSERVMRRLQLLWGVFPHLCGGHIDAGNSLAFATSLMKGLKLAGSGDTILMVSGAAAGRAETRTITVHRMP
jgi:pyruvate kinase